MIIKELTKQASLDILARSRLGRLACAKANQPYIVPIFFAHHERSLYCISTVGRKIEWMRENPLVAVEVDEIRSAQHWASIQVFGRYEELADTPETKDLRHLAWSLLQTHELWWEPGYVETVVGGAKRPMVPLYFRIHIDEITGHGATEE
jgi:nitroimidazol reductase NimA-like FMN-containing flavoprotein (pyridoxamine 5'-phosphate oxidase superfamily)